MTVKVVWNDKDRAFDVQLSPENWAHILYSITNTVYTDASIINAKEFLALRDELAIKLMINGVK